MDKFLLHSTPTKTVSILLAFSKFIRQGHARCRLPVGVQAVQAALCAIGVAFKLDTWPNPCYTDGHTRQYWCPLEELLAVYSKQDPPTQFKLAVPVSVAHWAATQARNPKCSTKTAAAGNMVNIAFYFLLQVGEYTCHPKSQNHHTQQFRVCNIKLWHGATLLNPTDPLPRLLNTSVATLTISNQKNRVCSDTVHLETTGQDTCQSAH